MEMAKEKNERRKKKKKITENEGPIKEKSYSSLLGVYILTQSTYF